MTEIDADAWLDRARAAMRRTRRPVTHYETRLGPALLERDARDPTRAWYVGDDFQIAMEDDLDARPVYANEGGGDLVEEIARPAWRAPRIDRTWGQRFDDSGRLSASASASFYEPVRAFFRGPSLGDVLGLTPDAEADERRAYRAVRTEHFRGHRDEQALLDAYDAPRDVLQEPLGAASDWGADFLGAMAGQFTDPLSFVGPGRTWIARVLWQAGIQGAQNATQQAIEIGTGVRRQLNVTPEGGETQGFAGGWPQLGREIEALRAAGGDEAVLNFLDTTALEDGAGAFDPLEVGLAAGLGAGFQAGAEGLEYGLKRALSPVGEAFLRGAARLRVRAAGDPELAALARLENGEVDPRAVPVEAAFASLDPWVREMAPAVERAALATRLQDRVDAYAEIVVRLQEAQAYGADPMAVTNALISADFRDALPKLKAFRAIEELGRAVAQGRIATDAVEAAGRDTARLLERLDPLAARMRRGPRMVAEALRAADQALTNVRAAEGEARPPRPVGVDNPAPPRRMANDDEVADIDALAESWLSLRAGGRTGPSLTSFVVKAGGIADDRGDVRAAIGGPSARPGLLNQNGKPLDDLALAAWEAGYFPESAERPDLRTFLDVLSADARGEQPRHAQADAEARGRLAERADIEAYLDRHGVNLNERDPQALRRDIAEKVFDAAYGRPLGPDDGPPPLGEASGARAQGGAPNGRAAPAGWGARKGQKIAGGGGAMLSPQERIKAYRTAMPPDTFFGRQGRALKRKGVRTYVRDVLDNAYTAFLEGQHPLVLAQKRLIDAIEKASGARLAVAPSDNAALLARLSRDGFSAGHLDLVDGVRPYRQPGVKASVSYREAVETAIGGKDWSNARIGAFEDYLIAKRAVKAWDRYARGELPRPPHAMSKMDLQDVIRALEQDNPHFAAGAAKLYAFLGAHWKKKRDAGLITDEQYQKGLGNNEDYVPFQRDMDEVEPDAGGAGGGDRTNKRKAFQRFRGSDRKILSPLTVIMQDVYDTADRIARNETYRAFVDMAAKAGDLGADIVKPVPRALIQMDIDVADETRRAAKAMGMNAQDAEALAGSIDALLNGETARRIYRPGDVIEGGRKIIYVWRDGKREAYELVDPEYADDLFKAMTGLTQEARDLFLDVVALPTQAIRTAITAWPGFQAANIIRDSLSAWMLTDLGYKPGEALYGAGQVLRQGDLAKLYNAVGTQGGGMVRAALPRARLQRTLPALRGKILTTRNLNPAEGVGVLWRAFEQATELSENATRIRLFARGFERARAQGLSDYDAALWAAYESRDYIDFQRSGAKMLNARRVVLFLNAALQGMDRTFRTMSNEGDVKTLLRPLVDLMRGQRTLANLTPDERYRVVRAYKLWTKMAMVGAFGLMLTALNADDEDYQYGFSDYIKNNYWLARAGQYWISIPKPFDLAVLSNIFERAYEGAHGGDPLAWGRLVRGLADTYAPPTEVTAAVIPFQLMANRTMTGAPIVPEGLEDLDPHLQATAMTTQVAIDFAKAVRDWTGIELSPVQLDHVFGGTFGEFFRAPARLLTQAANDDAAEMGLPDSPVINRFVREAGRGGTPARTAFYDVVMQRNGDLNRAAGTLNEYLERGDVESAHRFLSERAPHERAYAVLAVGFDADARRLHPARRARDVVTEMSRIRRELGGGRPSADEDYFLPELTPRQKRLALDALDDVQAAEMQAALVMTGAPGFAGRPMMDVDAAYERLRTIAPGVYALLRARLVTGREKAYAFETVRRAWPEAQRRLEASAFGADLGDLAAQARADFGENAIFRFELEREGGRESDARARDAARETLEEALGASP